MNTLRRNYDLVASATTGATLLALDTTIGLPWPLWTVWGAILAVQIGNRVRNGWAR